MGLNALERRTLDRWRQRGIAPLVADSHDGDEWVKLLLHLSLVCSRLVRSARLGHLHGMVRLKPDHTPVTSLERRIERLVAREIRRSAAPITFVGEETAPRDPGPGIALAVDPVDGTWSLVNRTGTVAISMAVLRDGRPFVGVVANPVSAEIAYAVDGRAPRLLQLGAFGEPDRAVTLPLRPAGPNGLLVSVQPHRASGPIGAALVRAWRDGELDMVRSPGGAPALELLEVAKGRFVYVNYWNRRDVAAWDLSAGLLLVRAAGGDVVDLMGNPLQSRGHRGPFIAGVHDASRARVASLVARAVTPDLPQ